jgi:hypothetical protein|eukprot:COSAG06_NODE_8281_length_2217_cov_2.566572_3_plen_183_part_00
MILVRQEPAWEEAMRHAAADTLIAKAVGCDLEQWTPGMIHRVSRLTARAEFQAIITAQREDGGTEPRGLGLAAEWVLACQHFATVARELVPKQELVDKAQKCLPDRIREYEDVRGALEEVIGEDCMVSPIPPAVSAWPTYLYAPISHSPLPSMLAATCDRCSPALTHVAVVGVAQASTPTKS